MTVRALLAALGLMAAGETGRHPGPGKGRASADSRLVIRPSDGYALATLLAAVLLGGLLLHGMVRERHNLQRVEATREFVRRETLTDLSLFTEARYTRHPAMADRHAAFQDHPLSLEHFPTGSLVSPGRGQ